MHLGGIPLAPWGRKSDLRLGCVCFGVMGFFQKSLSFLGFFFSFRVAPFYILDYFPQSEGEKLGCVLRCKKLSMFALERVSDRWAKDWPQW